MARDKRLPLTFSTVSSTTNVSGVSNAITATGNRSAVVTLTTTANQWAVGYSDALNFTHYRDMIGDTSNFTSGTVTSSITGDPILPNSTSGQSYFLRASISPIGFYGPDNFNIMVQGANDPGTGVAPTALNSFSTVSVVQPYTANCYGLTGATAALASPAVIGSYTGTTPVSGSIVMFAGAGGSPTGLSAETPYVALQTASNTFTLVTSLTTSTPTAVNITAGSLTSSTVLVANNATALSPLSLTGNFIQFAESVSVGDIVVFGSVGSMVGLTAGQAYYVNAVGTSGASLASSAGGTTITITGSLGTPYVGKVNLYNNPAVFPSSVASNVITTVMPHGLVVGQMVVASSTAGGLTVNTPYYVNTVPSQTTFTVAATIGGSTATVSSTPGALFVGKPPRIMNVQVGMTVRPWLRMGVQQLNGSIVNRGFVGIYVADFSIGRDTSQAL